MSDVLKPLPMARGASAPASYGVRRLRSQASAKQKASQMSNSGAAPLNADSKEEFDEYGAELGEHARVWKAYVKEADKFDIEQVDGWNRSLDVTLIFAALFTAICTAFVIESSKSLRVDATEASARRLDQITSILLVVANVSNPSELNPTQIIAPEPFSPRRIDLWVNILWFFSLILSAAVSLTAMLAKEWCYLFISGRIGDPWSQTKKRQQRWEGIEKWKMEQVIMFLPSFMHLAFLSFAIGVCIYLGDLHWGVAIPAGIVTLVSMLVYTASTLLPLFEEMSPYSTSISRLIKRLKAFGTNSDVGDEPPSNIDIRALAWLIKSSEDPKSTDKALQAIAGADPNDEDRALLRNSKADKMILRRLIGLDSYSRDYDQILDLYTRAQSFFQSSPPTLVVQKGAPNSTQTEVPGPDTEAQKKSTGPPPKNLNRELQKKLRDLRDMINKKITTYATSDPVFLPVTHNIEALRIGSTAASYCLQSLQHGAQTQTEEQFDSAVVLLESHRNGEAYLHTKEIQYLMTGAAMLLSSLLVDCPPTLRARDAMRLLRIADRVKDGQRQLRLEHLGLPLAVYALSRHDYPCATQPPPLTPISRAERAIEVISHYVMNPKELDRVTPTMVNIGLLQLLSDSEECNLEPADIVAISEAFMDDVEAGQALIYTFAANPYPSTYSRTLRSIATIASHECGKPSKDTVTIACLSVLNHTRLDDPIADAPIGQVYAFVLECVLDLPLATPEAYGVKAALDVMQKLTNYPGWTPELILNLAESLDKREIVTKLKKATELDATVNYQDFEMKLFATGQAYFLLNLALRSKTAADQEAWRCLAPFIGGERLWGSSEDARRNLLKQATILGERYRTMWGSDNTRRHSYYQTLLPPAETSEGSSQPANL